MRKPCITLLITILFASLLFITAQGSSQYQPLTVYDEEDRIISIAACNGTYYVLKESGLYAPNEENTKMDSIMLEWEGNAENESPQISILLSNNETLYCIDFETGQIYEAAMKPDRIVFSLLFALDIQTNSRFSSPFISGEFLMIDTGRETLIVDLVSGETKTQNLGQLSKLTAGKKNQYIALEPKMEAVGTSLHVLSIDAKTGEKEPLGRLDYNQYIDATLYDSEKDILYFSSRGSIYAWHDGVHSVIATYPTGDINQFILIDSDFVGLSVDSSLFVLRSTQPNQETKRFVVMEKHGRGSEHIHFISAHNDFEFSFAALNQSSVEELFTQDMLSGSSTVDVYVFTDPSILEAIKRKHFGMDLSTSSYLKDFEQKLYPYIKNIISDGDYVFAMPKYLYLPAWGYYKEAFEELDLSIPTTYKDYFEFCIRWYDEFAEDYPDYSFDPFLGGEIGLVSLLRDYASEREKNGLPVIFSNQSLQDTLDAFHDLEKQKMQITQGDSPLFTTIDIPYVGQYKRLPLVFEEGHRSVASPVQDHFYFFVVNPFSEMQNEAFEFIETWMKNMEPHSKLVLSPHSNQPVENPQYQSTMDVFYNELEDLQERRLIASPLDSQAITQEIELKLQEKEAFDKLERWTISSEDIEERDAEIGSAFISTSNPITLLMKVHPDYFQVFLGSPQPNIEQLLKQLDATIAVIMEESM